MIDEINDELPTLQSFILPKGDIHNARAIVRRAERAVWYVVTPYGIDQNTAIYLNRVTSPEYFNSSILSLEYRKKGKNKGRKGYARANSNTKGSIRFNSRTKPNN